MTKTNSENTRLESPQTAREKMMHRIIREERREKERLQEEVVHLRKDLTKLALDVRWKNEFNGQIHRFLQEIYQLKDVDQRQQRIGELLQTTRDQIRVSESFETFQFNIEKLSSAFFHRLENSYPNLTRTEKELCGFLRLGMQTKDIAATRGVSTKSIEMARYRLRKKLPIRPNMGITQFLERF